MELFRVVAYDIREDRNRTKTHKLMKGYLNPVQYSVFEGMLTHRNLNEVISRVKDYIEEEEDSLRIYSLCNKCAQNAVLIGGARLHIDEGFYVI